MDNLDIVEKYDCKDEYVLKQVYLRAFAYIYNILRREGHEKHMDKLKPLIQEMLLRLDENIVLKHLRRKHIDTYYKFLSPIQMIDDDKSEVIISHNDLELIKKENEYLYSQIAKYKKKNKSLKKEIKLIKNSKGYKLTSSFANPIRKLR